MSAQMSPPSPALKMKESPFSAATRSIDRDELGLEIDLQLLLQIRHLALGILRETFDSPPVSPGRCG